MTFGDPSLSEIRKSDLSSRLSDEPVKYSSCVFQPSSSPGHPLISIAFFIDIVPSFKQEIQRAETVPEHYRLSESQKSINHVQSCAEYPWPSVRRTKARSSPMQAVE